MSRVTSRHAVFKKPTVRQLEVLEATHYGEVSRIPTRFRNLTLDKIIFDGVDVSSVVRLLAKRKLLRWRTAPREAWQDPFRYAVPTKQGLETLEKYRPCND